MRQPLTSTLILASTLLLCPPVTPQGTATPEPGPPIVLTAARIFTGVDGSIEENGGVVVRGGEIVAAGSGITVPEGATVIDLGDATLLPGFMDAHVHLTGEMSDNWYQDFHDNFFRFPTEQAHYAARWARRTLEAGFTTVRNVGAGDYLDIGLRNAIDAGVIPGPRVLTAVHGIGSTGGHCDQEPYPPDRIAPATTLEGTCDGAESCREAVRQQMKFGADVIKICASGGVLSLADPVDVPQLTAAELEAIMSEAHAWGRKVAAHAHGDEAARLAVEAGVDSIEHGTFLSDKTLELMKQKGTWLVPTRMAVEEVGAAADNYPPAVAEKARAAAAGHSEMFERALAAGVPIAFGTDSGVSPHGRNAEEFRLMVELGMEPARALLSATRDAARLLGIESETGTLEPGKAADVVAVPGNPLEDITATERVLFVMRSGEVVRAPGS
ncbi:MAG: amidohydrolase family protein [Thermoanaerobaculia bacterium]